MTIKTSLRTVPPAGAKEPAMLLRAIIVWLCLMVVAIANGALREMLILPRLGARIGAIC